MGRGEAYIRRFIKNRLWDLNQNYIATAVGQLGSGKSWGMLRLAEIITEDPKMGDGGDIRLSLSVEDFLRDVPDLRQGQAMLWDETGATGGGAREWNTIKSRAMSYITESFRFLNAALLLTVPDVGMADITFRRLGHMVFWFRKIDRKRDRSLAFVYEWRSNPLDGKTFPAHPVIHLESGPFKLRGIWFKKPAENLINTYESLKESRLRSSWEDLKDRAAGLK